MKARNILISCGVVLSTVVATANAAKAAAFISNVSQTSDPKANIFLNSITQNGLTFNNFSFVNRARIISNTPINPSDPLNSGAASTDRGDNATAPYAPNPDPTAQEIAAYLGNNNLNNIIDTEDIGAFEIDIFFDSEIVQDNTGLDNIFYWERNFTGVLDIQALDAAGNTIGKKININQTTNPANFAGFRIDTTEVGNQFVASWGINLNTLEVDSLSGLKLIANSNYVGPDFKFIARRPGPLLTTVVPEPTTVLGLGAVATLAFLRRRQFKSILSR